MSAYEAELVPLLMVWLALGWVRCALYYLSEEVRQMFHDPRIVHRPIPPVRENQVSGLNGFGEIVPESEQWMWILTALLMLIVIAIGLSVS